MDRNVCILIDQLAGDIMTFAGANPGSLTTDYIAEKFDGLEAPDLKVLLTAVRKMLIDNGNLVRADKGVGRVNANPAVPPFNVMNYFQANAGVFQAEKIDKVLAAKKKEIEALEAQKKSLLGDDPLRAAA